MIRAKVIGAEIARGKVITFLDRYDAGEVERE